MLVVAGCNGAVVLDPIEEPLDLVAELVDAGTEGRRIDAMVEWTDVGIGTAIRDLGAQGVAVVAAICQQDAVRPKCAEHFDAGRAVVRLSLGYLQRDRETVAVNDCMNLGRKPTAGTAHATTSTAFFSPLAAC